MTKTVTIDGSKLTIDDVVAVARDGAKVELANGVLERLEKNREIIKNALKQGKKIYGVTTGIGSLCTSDIDESRVSEFQKNLVKSHSCAVGAPLPEDAVKSILLIRINAFSKGYSGIKPKTLETLVSMLNCGVVPVVPEQGSVGASGDLSPLSHIALVTIGLGEAFYKGKRMSGAEAMKSADIPTLELRAREGLALVNGTQAMTGIGALVLYDAEQLAKHADIAGAMSFEALLCSDEPLDERIHNVRPHKGQIISARNIKMITQGSKLRESHRLCAKIQDAYSLRCMPQVHGATRDALAYARQVLEIEMNSSTNNPLIFSEDGVSLSGGNFHGQPVAFAMDFLGIAVSELGNISDRRTARLVDDKLNENLPPFLIKDAGINSGLMITQYTTASLVSENKVLAHPASVDSIPTSANQEDHVSMGTIAARKARSIVDNVQRVLAIELLCAAQAIDLRKPLRPSKGIEAAHKVFRETISFLEADREMYVDINKSTEILKSGDLIDAVEKAVGKLD